MVETETQCEFQFISYSSYIHSSVSRRNVDQWSYIWDGYLIVPKEGEYTFEFQGHHKVSFFIESRSTALLNQIQLTSSVNQTCTKTLPSGFVFIQIKYSKSWTEKTPLILVYWYGEMKRRI